jgi:acetyl esterase/lipase
MILVPTAKTKESQMRYHPIGMTVSAAVLVASVWSSSAVSQDDSDVTLFQQVEAQIDADAVDLSTVPSDTVNEEIWRDFGTERWVTNVTRPTLLPVLPDDPSQTRTAVLVVPGGGFQFVSIDNEGYPIAQWLADRGIAAFVLKYRTMPTPSTAEGFAEHFSALWNRPADAPPLDLSGGVRPAVEDAQAALTMIRSNSDAWGFDADKVGILGFSAGATTAIRVSLDENPQTPKPAFMGYIYGPMSAVEVPSDAPPMFNALAADDALFAGQGFGLIESWQAAGVPVEFHYYEKGGHGFGSYQRGVSADDWFDQFVTWMDAGGWLEPADSEAE